MKWFFSINELYLLGGILQVPGFIGLDDPFIGYLTEEIQECMEVARQSLSDRGYLQESEDGFVLEADLIKAIQTMATSRQVVVAGKDASSLFVFYESGFGVEQESMPDGKIAISTYEDYKVTKEHIYSLVGLPTTNASLRNSFLIDSNILEDARSLSSAEGKTPSYKEFLIEHGVKQDTALTLSEILSMNSQKGTLEILERNSLSITPQKSLAWVMGEQGGWAIEPLPESTKPIMSWKPVSSSEVCNKIHALLETIQA